jgi:hypothetical protein
MKHKDIGSFEFASTMEKLRSSPVDNAVASHIHQIAKRVQAARDLMGKQYKAEIIEKFAKRDEAGKIVNAPDGRFDVDDDKVLEFQKETDAFGEREIEIDWRPFDARTFSEIKVSAKELDLLGDLYSHEPVGPGLPHMGMDHQGNVHQLK